MINKILSQTNENDESNFFLYFKPEKVYTTKPLFQDFSIKIKNVIVSSRITNTDNIKDVVFRVLDKPDKLSDSMFINRIIMITQDLNEYIKSVNLIDKIIL